VPECGIPRFQPTGDRLHPIFRVRTGLPRPDRREPHRGSLSSSFFVDTANPVGRTGQRHGGQQSWQRFHSAEPTNRDPQRQSSHSFDKLGSWRCRFDVRAEKVGNGCSSWNGKTLEMALVKHVLAGQCGSGRESHRMRQGGQLKELLHPSTSVGSEHEMPMIRHQTIRKNAAQDSEQALRQEIFCRTLVITSLRKMAPSVIASMSRAMLVAFFSSMRLATGHPQA